MCGYTLATKMAKFYGNIISLRENIAKSFRGGATFLTHNVYKNEKSFSIYLRTLKMFSVSVILSPLKLHQQKTLIALQRIFLTSANSCLQQIAKPVITTS